MRDSDPGSVLGSLKTITDQSHTLSVHAAKVVPSSLIDRCYLTPPLPGRELTCLIDTSASITPALPQLWDPDVRFLSLLPLCVPSIKLLRLKVEAPPFALNPEQRFQENSTKQKQRVSHFSILHDNLPLPARQRDQWERLQQSGVGD